MSDCNSMIISVCIGFSVKITQSKRFKVPMIFSMQLTQREKIFIIVNLSNWHQQEFLTHVRIIQKTVDDNVITSRFH